MTRRRLRRVHRDVERWVADVNSWTARNYPGCPAFPLPIPRDEASMRLGVEMVMALLRSLEAGERGGDALAVFGEHAPVIE